MRVATRYPPTWRIHLGHLYGIVDHMIAFQREHECFFMVADMHALSLTHNKKLDLDNLAKDVVLDWVAAGVDPEVATVYRESDIPELAELALYLSMITPRDWLDDNQALHEVLDAFGDPELDTHALLGYPCLIAADFSVVGAELLPVGPEQLEHLELVRRIIGRFNEQYGELLVEPSVHNVGERSVPGFDGRKMSTFRNNVVWLDTSDDRLQEAVQVAPTDPEKQASTDPGDPELCTVFHWWRLAFADEAARVDRACRAGRLGCAEDKAQLATRLGDALRGFREARAELASRAGLADDVLAAGQARVRPLAVETLDAVRNAMGLSAVRSRGQ